MASELNPLTIPLQGVNLIEASAGTGKTWNIAALFVRLVLLERLNVAQVLVVTFTKAATAELKTRLRARLEEALSALKTMEQSDGAPQDVVQDAFLRDLLEQALQQESLPRLMLRLQAAIADFDNAAIYTIHGFCQRVLKDFAFFCGIPFEIELQQNEGTPPQLLAAQDFWRSRISPDKNMAALSDAYKRTPQTEYDELGKFLSRPYLQYRDEGVGVADWEAAQQDLNRLWQRVAPKLEELRLAFEKLHESGLNGNAYRKNTYAEKFDRLGALASDEAADAAQLQGILINSKKENPWLAEQFYAAAKANAHLDDAAIAFLSSELGELCEQAGRVCALRDRVMVGNSYALLRYLAEQNQVHKMRSPQRNFDDLLLDVYQALQPDNRYADDLANAIAETWQVALIDEFQDTDPLQYRIFERAFVETKRPLFLVGDPKQAIYAFRGADIYAYLEAKQQAEAGGQVYTLSTNRRTHRRLVDAVGRLFARNNPFLFDKIDYQKIAAARDEARLQPLDAPLKIRWLNDADTQGSTQLQQRAAEWCAAEIVDLLNRAAAGEVKLGERALQSGDIAVLVRTHSEGSEMQQALRRCGVQSVLLSRDNVFAGEEAKAVFALLDFIVHPNKTTLLRYVLAGVLFDYDAADLLRLNEQEDELSEWVSAANQALALWQKHGVFAAVQDFLGRYGVEQRLLAQGNERALTNLYQLLELLAQEDEVSHVPESLLQWLSVQIGGKGQNSADEEAVLRLESDEHLVKIVTMHASKGLQYPVVFCPFVWRGAGSQSDDWCIVHTDGGRAELVHKSDLSQEERERLQQEQTAEGLRLLYVALTRAAEQLVLYQAYYDKTASSIPLAYLSGYTEPDAAKKLKAEEKCQYYYRHWQDFMAGLGADSGIAWYDGLSGAAADYVAAEQGGQTFTARVFPERKFDWVRQTSFTGLLRQHEQSNADDEMLPALDAAEQLPTGGAPVSVVANGELFDTIHAFPKGAAAGVCLHEILEKLNFAERAEAQQDMIDRILDAHGMDAPRWGSVIAEMCNQVRLLPLKNELSLAVVPREQQLPEMGFLLYIDALSLAELKTWFKNSSLPKVMKQAAAGLRFRDVRDFLNGFIDMVLADGAQTAVVIDYKSNYLGADAEAYTQQAIEAAVAEHHYYLQALLYALALARYLKQRNALPETVSVRYLFLRGAGETKRHGVWQWDIAVDDLRQWL